MGKREDNRKYKEVHKEAIAVQTRIYKTQNRKKILAKQRVTNKRLREERKVRGVCLHCGNPEICNELHYRTGKKNIQRRCERCYLRYVAKYTLGSCSKWELLKELFLKQGGICAYSGKPILIGRGAVIDHRTALAKGGANEIGNLQWIDWRINLMKWELSEREFLDLCRTITAQAERGGFS